MKVTAVKSYPIMTWRPHLFVKVETDEGLYGLGESGLTWQEAEVDAAIRRLSQVVVGEDPFRSQYLWQLMYRGAFFPGDKVAVAAISAIDMALWDIKGKALGQPVYNLLGGLVRDKVACYSHNQQPDERDVDALVDSCRRSWEEGWRYVRWHLPFGPPDAVDTEEGMRLGVEQVAAVREEIGDDVGICVDVHTRLSPVQAVRFCREVEPYAPFFIEDALRSEDPASYRSLRRQTSVPLAAGEQWVTKWGFRVVIEEELVDYVRVDLCIAGGISEALTITRWAESHHMSLVPHNPLGPVSAAACAHLCFAAPNFAVLEMGRPPRTILNDVFPMQIPFEHGHVLPPTAPGLGVELNEEALATYSRPSDGFAPITKRLDGSYNNW